jgi:hypothetical protein
MVSLRSQVTAPVAVDVGVVSKSDARYPSTRSCRITSRWCATAEPER